MSGACLFSVRIEIYIWLDQKRNTRTLDTNSALLPICDHIVSQAYRTPQIVNPFPNDARFSFSVYSSWTTTMWCQLVTMSPTLPSIRWRQKILRIQLSARLTASKLASSSKRNTRPAKTNGSSPNCDSKLNEMERQKRNFSFFCILFASLKTSRDKDLKGP